MIVTADKESSRTGWPDASSRGKPRGAIDQLQVISKARVVSVPGLIQDHFPLVVLTGTTRSISQSMATSNRRQ